MGRLSHLGAIAAGIIIGIATATPAGASALTISPLAGTRDASPSTQISFLGVPPAQISSVRVVGSRTGAHSGRMAAYASATGASFLPSRPFSEGEHVSVSVQVGPSGQTRRVTTTFTVARSAAYTPTPLAQAPTSSGHPSVQSFVSQTKLTPPRVQVIASSPKASAGDIFLTPTHGQPGPMILEGSGNLVWFHPVPHGTVATDLQVQRYKGEPVLVWWEGSISSLGVGFGSDEIVGEDYRPIAKIAGGNGYHADLHDIQLAPGGSAYITAYSFVREDLASAGGPREGSLIDAIVQRIDVKTGLVMFEWHALGHIALSDSHSQPTSSRPWDFFHLNSISLDPWGGEDFLISARNTWAGYEISGHTGAVLWRLGGRHSTFHMGAGTGTAWQHDMRWQSDHTITIFDDGAMPAVHSQSRAIREHIDWSHRSVGLQSRYVHTPALSVGSQGNDESMSNGNTFIGWGEQPYFSEVGPAGETLFDARLAYPSQSYRAYRFAWRGRPTGPPTATAKTVGAGAIVYASWNGATNVASWRVLTGSTASALTPLVTVPRNGFETTIDLPRAPHYYAVQALDVNGRALSTSRTASV